MSDAFTRAVDRLFEDRNLSKLAVYRPPGNGSPARVKVVLGRPDAEADLLGGQILSQTGEIQVRVSELPSPAVGGVFEVEGRSYKVQSPPRVRDSRGLIWSLDAPPVASF